MAFNTQLTNKHIQELNKNINDVLADVDPKIRRLLTELVNHVRYYADLEDENVLTSIADLQNEVKDMTIVYEYEDRLNELEATIEQLKKENRQLAKRLDKLEKQGGQRIRGWRGKNNE
ncbi:hypothetical protein ACFQGR_04600 [Weissella sagaensis]|uniref:Uncharacterized protein n=1 Tax=Weissella sagaensis TaxID=2559928 RepID=A0ABW1RT85_9LACO|nr:hypothetical protein [Weissella sagaensis]